MSVQYCHTCNKMIDTDLDIHFIEHEQGCLFAGLCEPAMMKVVNDSDGRLEPCECP